MTIKATPLGKLQDEPEKESHRFKSTLPTLSYRQAMQSWFITNGVIHQVGTCSPAEFQELVEACTKTAKNPKVCKCDLVGLNYTELLSRWYILLELHRHGAKIPLYATAEEAKNAILVAKSEESEAKICQNRTTFHANHAN